MVQSEDERRVEEFLIRQRLTDLQKRILKRVLAAGPITRPPVDQGDFYWVQINGEPIGGPCDPNLSAEGIEAADELQEAGLLGSDGRLTPKGRRIAQALVESGEWA